MSRWAGLPSWPDLIEALALYLEEHNSDAVVVRADAARGDLLQAASYGFDQLTPHQVGELFARYVSTAAQPHEVHRKIVGLGPHRFITTNYDNLLEEAEIVHARAIDFIFKPHGDAGDSASIVSTREQYRQLLPSGEWHAAMEALKTRVQPDADSRYAQSPSDTPLPASTVKNGPKALAVGGFH